MAKSELKAIAKFLGQNDAAIDLQTSIIASDNKIKETNETVKYLTIANSLLNDTNFAKVQRLLDIAVTKITTKNGELDIFFQSMIEVQAEEFAKVHLKIGERRREYLRSDFLIMEAIAKEPFKRLSASKGPVAFLARDTENLNWNGNTDDTAPKYTTTENLYATNESIRDWLYIVDSKYNENITGNMPPYDELGEGVTSALRIRGNSVIEAITSIVTIDGEQVVNGTINIGQTGTIKAVVVKGTLKTEKDLEVISGDLLVTSGDTILSHGILNITSPTDELLSIIANKGATIGTTLKVGSDTEITDGNLDIKSGKVTIVTDDADETDGNSVVTNKGIDIGTNLKVGTGVEVTTGGVDIKATGNLKVENGDFSMKSGSSTFILGGENYGIDVDIKAQSKNGKLYFKEMFANDKISGKEIALYSSDVWTNTDGGITLAEENNGESTDTRTFYVTSTGNIYANGGTLSIKSDGDSILNVTSSKIEVSQPIKLLETSLKVLNNESDTLAEITEDGNGKFVDLESTGAFTMAGELACDSIVINTSWEIDNNGNGTFTSLTNSDNNPAWEIDSVGNGEFTSLTTSGNGGEWDISNVGNGEFNAIKSSSNGTDWEIDSSGNMDIESITSNDSKFGFTSGGAGYVTGTMKATKFDGPATSTYYADLAEKYKIDKRDIKDLVPGTVISFSNDCYGDENCRQGEVELYDEMKPFAGVISTNPGLCMNDNEDTRNEEYIFLVLKGRVPVKTKENIKKGMYIFPSYKDPGYCKFFTKREVKGFTPLEMSEMIGISISDTKDGFVEVKV